MNNLSGILDGRISTMPVNEFWNCDRRFLQNFLFRRKDKICSITVPYLVCWFHEIPINILNFQVIRKFVFLKKVTFLECVNCVAFRPSDTSMCATASDDFSIKIWHSRKANRKRNNATCQ